MNTIPILGETFVVGEITSSPVCPLAGAVMYPLDLEREKELRAVVCLRHPMAGLTAQVEVTEDNGVTWVIVVPPFAITSGSRVATASPFTEIPHSLRKLVSARVRLACVTNEVNASFNFVHLQTR